MAIPFVFATQSGNVPASQLDSNFTYVLNQNNSVKNSGAVGDGVTDDSGAIQSAINSAISAGGGEIFFPAGRYIVNSRLKIQNTYVSNAPIKLRGVSSGNQNVAAASTFGSILVGQTSGIALDCAGASNLTLEDMSIISGPANPSTIGIIGQRIGTSPFFQNVKLIRVSIGITPNAGANGGLGTYAFINKNGEHHQYHDCWFYADNAHLADGSNTYPTLKSPDFAVTAGSLSLNYWDNCAFLSASGHGSEIRAGAVMEYRGGYYLVPNAKTGVTFFGSNLVKVDGVNIELSGGGTPAALVNVLDNTSGLVVRATTPIAGLTGVLLTNGATLFGADIQLFGTFTKVWDPAGGSGGGLVTGGRILYNSNSGHTVPTTGIFGSTVTDVFTGATQYYGNGPAYSFANGVPNNANGANNDFYFRGDGTQAGNTVIYHKQAGAWVALITT